jgi:hypothetical protein
MRKGTSVWLLGTVILAAWFLADGWPQEVVAEQTGSFSGSWIASGQRHAFDFVEGRQVGTFKLTGHVNLAGEIGATTDFWAECVGLADSVAGSAVRCVWRSLDGDKAYSVLRGRPMATQLQIDGEFVGGTGRLKGIEGTFRFTWSSVFINERRETFTGHTRDLQGSYRIP